MTLLRSTLCLSLWLLPTLVLALDRYRVTLDDAWRTGVGRVAVDACFDGPPPAELVRHSRAAEFTLAVRAPSRSLAGDDRHLRTASLPDDACISWEVDLARAAAAGDHRLAMRVGDAMVTEGDLWFWRDNDRRSIQVEIDAPPGVSVSVPWPERSGSSDIRVFRPERTSAHRRSRLALGRFATRVLEVPGARLRLAVLGAPEERQVDAYGRWIAETAESVASITGRFPHAGPQVLVIALARQREAVPWAHVVRGGGVAVEFFVDGTRTPGELRADWTATHEFAHLLLPHVSSRDRWLSEGLASYYQNVLRARDGRLDEREAWAKLDSGFERGQRATTGGTLAAATRSGLGATMRVYWSGAAIMLKADARLRALSDGRQSLDAALAALHACCHDPARTWRARELFARLDVLTGHAVFVPLYEAHVWDDEFPDLADTYRQLGLEPGSERMRFDPGAPWSRIRHRIMSESGAARGAGTPGGR